MAGDNEFVPFAYGGGANVEDIASWIADVSLRSNGLQPGIVLGTQLNRALRQGTAIGPALAAMMANITDRDVLDDGVPDNFWLTFWLTILQGHSFLDIGGANAYVVAAPFGLVFPAPVDGLMINVRIATTNTGTSTLNWMGTGALPIRHADNSPVAPGDLLAGMHLTLICAAGATWQMPAVAIPGKTILLANADFYVATTGNDTTGIGTAGAPWLTLQHAYDYVANNVLNFGGYTITIHVADGTYAAGLATSVAPFGGGAVTFLGNTATPANVVVNTSGANCFSANRAASLIVRGFTLNSNISGGAGGAGLAALDGGRIEQDSNSFGLCQFAHAFASFNGLIRNNGNYSIVNNSPIHWYSSASGNIVASPTGTTITATFVGTCTFATAFALVSNGSIYAPSNVFAGPAVSGTKRFDIQANGIIDSAGNDPATYFPGTSAGTTSSGGEWV